MRRLVKRFHPPGTSPGTLPPPRGLATGLPRLWLALYDAESFSEETIPSVEGIHRRVPPGKRAWLRIVGHDPELMAQVASVLSVHPLVVEDILNVGQRPKVEDHEDYLFVVMDVPERKDGELVSPQVSLLLFADLLVTVEEEESQLFALVERRLQLAQGKIRRLGLDYLAYSLIDAGVDHFFPVLDVMGEELDELEDEVLAGADRHILARLHALKRDLLQLRKGAWPLREALGALARLDSPLVDPANRLWLRDVYDHTVQIIDIIESFRDLLAGLVDLHLSSSSNRMNEIMRVLTVIATIFIPLTLVAGIYGMNFTYMPELQWKWGYPAVLLFMAVAAAGMVAAFKRRGWF
ncbi:MAG: magnesium/cobalt transporter CorA [Thermoanaerobaculaceae bacterium]|nr:magnesium/cobalt transporter CorA [Thermoanaerobaculaceae bacterium]